MRASTATHAEFHCTITLSSLATEHFSVPTNAPPNGTNDRTRRSYCISSHRCIRSSRRARISFPRPTRTPTIKLAFSQDVRRVPIHRNITVRHRADRRNRAGTSPTVARPVGTNEIPAMAICPMVLVHGDTDTVNNRIPPSKHAHFSPPSHLASIRLGIRTRKRSHKFSSSTNRHPSQY